MRRPAADQLTVAIMEVYGLYHAFYTQAYGGGEVPYKSSEEPAPFIFTFLLDLLSIIEPWPQ